MLHTQYLGLHFEILKYVLLETSLHVSLNQLSLLDSESTTYLRDAISLIRGDLANRFGWHLDRVTLFRIAQVLLLNILVHFMNRPTLQLHPDLIVRGTFVHQLWVHFE